MSALSLRLTEIVCMSASDFTDKEIALRESLDEKTIETHWRRLRDRYGSASRAGLVTRALAEIRSHQSRPPSGADPALRPLFCDDRALFSRLAPQTREISFDGLVPRWENVTFGDGLWHGGIKFVGLGTDPFRTMVRWKGPDRRPPFPFPFDRPCLLGDRPYGRRFDQGRIRVATPAGTLALGFELSSLGTTGYAGATPHDPVTIVGFPDLSTISVRQGDSWTRHHIATLPDVGTFAGVIAPSPIDEVVLRPGETCYPIILACVVG